MNGMGGVGSSGSVGGGCGAIRIGTFWLETSWLYGKREEREKLYSI